MSHAWDLPYDIRNVFPNWFISNTDPALDVAGNHVLAGKPWIKMTNDSSPWGAVIGLFIRNADNSGWESMLSSGPTGATGPAGVDGAAGADGSVIRSGAGVPSDGLGLDGDWYINTDTLDLFQRAAGTYSIITNIRGAQGFMGLHGLQGDDGEPGSPGIKGDKGDQGVVGPIGLSIPGPPGFDGEDGDSGLPGIKGDRGDTGATGAAGPTGASIPGPPGEDGNDGQEWAQPPGGSSSSSSGGASVAGGADHLYLFSVLI